MRPSSRSSWTTWSCTVPFSLLFTATFILPGCCGVLCPRPPIPVTVVPSCPPAILVEPTIQTRPEVLMRYKIENEKEWFALDRPGLSAIRAYVYELEGSLSFTRDMIRESNKTQSGER